MEEREWDEDVEREVKFFFGDEVVTPDGEYGRVTEVDSEGSTRYRVDGKVHLGWYNANDLKKV